MGENISRLLRSWNASSSTTLHKDFKVWFFFLWTFNGAAIRAKLGTEWRIMLHTFRKNRRLFYVVEGTDLRAVSQVLFFSASFPGHIMYLRWHIVLPKRDYLEYCSATLAFLRNISTVR